MTTLEQAARQALEALECHADIGIKADKQITALRQALAHQPKQEPVAWYDKHGMLTHDPFEGVTPLYTEPPRREWIELTDEELVAAYMSVGDKEWAIGGMKDATKFAKALEAKLKEKNA